MKRLFFFVGRMVRRIVASVCIALCLLYTCALVFVWQGRAGTAPAFPVDCAVVFGAAVHPIRGASGKITGYEEGPGIRRRVAAAAELYANHSVSKLYLTGGKGTGAPLSEADIMRRVALERGVKEGDIVLEGKATSTKENIAYTQPLTAGCRTLVGVSDGYHLGRIRILSQIAGWPLETYPAEENHGNAFLLQNWLREAAGITLLVMERLLT